MYGQSLAFFTTSLSKDFTNYYNRRLAEVRLLQGQLYFILYVRRHPGCTPKEPAKRLRMDIGHTTRLLTKLEQRRFLEQESSPNDGRTHILRLTEREEAAFRLNHELFARWGEMVLGGFTTEERGQLMGFLKKTLRMEGGMLCIRNNIQPR